MGLEKDDVAAALRSYKYMGPPLSLLERVYLNQFWEMVIEKFVLFPIRERAKTKVSELRYQKKKE